MKKFVLILVVLSVVFASCASPVDEPEVVEPVNPFEGRWLYAPTGIIFERRGNTITFPNGNTTHYEYDDTYYNEWMTG